MMFPMTLADDALVVRGGQNLPDNFRQGSEVGTDAGGLLSGIDAETASRLFTPTFPNPNRVK